MSDSPTAIAANLPRFVVLTYFLLALIVHESEVG
jgi:hypothetical protein